MPSRKASDGCDYQMNSPQTPGRDIPAAGDRRIVAFAKDWDDVPTSITHVLREMGKTIPVLWINSIGTRKPDLRHARDLQRIIRRIGAFFQRAQIKENRVRVLSPFLVPKAQTSFSRWLNRILFDLQISRELRDMGNSPVEYWCSVPNAVDLLPRRMHRLGWSVSRNDAEKDFCFVGQSTGGALTTAGRQLAANHDEPIVVYYCVDDWSKFEGLDGKWLEQKERQMLKRADIVFTPAQYLVQKCCRTIEAQVPDPDHFILNAGASCQCKVHHIPHGVEYEKFATALDSATVVPSDISGMAKPIIGFYGNIYEWIDFALLAELARRRSDWSFVIIGQVYCDVSRFDSIPNVHFIGRREHDQLPGYCKGFNAAIIPYDLNDARMQSVSPVKARELLAAGVPIVAALIPELSACGEDVVMCEGVEAWLTAIEKQSRRTDRAAISKRMETEDWRVRVSELRRKVDRIHS